MKNIYSNFQIFYSYGSKDTENFRSAIFIKYTLQYASTIWPDLVSAHYAKTTLNWLAEKGINFVEKNINPPNCPQFRPIERYWAIVKRVFKKTGKAAGNMQEFKKIWAQASKKRRCNTCPELDEERSIKSSKIREGITKISSGFHYAQV